LPNKQQNKERSMAKHCENIFTSGVAKMEKKAEKDDPAQF